jgi:hypothetical protein
MKHIKWKCSSNFNGSIRKFSLKSRSSTLYKKGNFYDQNEKTLRCGVSPHVFFPRVIPLADMHFRRSKRSCDYRNF